MSTRLHSSERKRRAQTAELTEARAEISRLARRAKETAAAKESEERAALNLALRERDEDLTRLREKLEAATGELSEEQDGTAALRERLEASERDVRDALERAAVAEEDAAEQTARAAKAESAGRGLGAAVEKQIAELESTVGERNVAAQRAREEARSAVASLTSAEEEGRRQVREAVRAREQLGVERERSARLKLELEVCARGIQAFGSARLCVCVFCAVVVWSFESDVQFCVAGGRLAMPKPRLGLRYGTPYQRFCARGRYYTLYCT